MLNFATNLQVIDFLLVSWLGELFVGTLNSKTGRQAKAVIYNSCKPAKYVFVWLVEEI